MNDTFLLLPCSLCIKCPSGERCMKRDLVIDYDA